MKREDILRRIRALAAKTVKNGCTEAEALAAAAVMAKLVDRYGFTQADIDAPLEELTEMTIRATRTANGHELFAVAVSEYCDCKVFRRERDMGGYELVFFGTEPDTLMCGYLMALLGTANKAGLKSYMAAFPGLDAKRKRLVTRSFDAGMASRIRDRLREMKAARNKEGENGQTGGALVAVKDARVTEEFAKRYRTRKRANRSRTCHLGAYSAGAEAGARVSINPGAGATGSRSMIG